ncbi:MAG: fibronectin type III domain-containing protein, partial [Polyangiaceae bacterium]
IAVDTNLWIADTLNNRIRKSTIVGAVSTLAGSASFSPIADGTGAAATFFGPEGIALDGLGNAFVADTDHHCIRKVTSAGVVTTVAGNGTASFADGPGATAEFNTPAGIAVDPAGSVYVGDSVNNRVRKIVFAGSRQIAVTWSAPSSDGGAPIMGYTASASATGYPTQTCSATVTMCTISGLRTGVAYSVSVTASNAAGTSAVSPAAMATPN